MLARQLRRALAKPPRIRSGETVHDYLRQQAAHVLAHPELFPPATRGWS